MSDDVPPAVVGALKTVLEHVDTERFPDSEARVEIEYNCQNIHAKFGGEAPEEIYPDSDGGGDG